MAELRDKWDQFAGDAKKKLGEVTDDEHLAEEGREQEAGGKVNELLDEAGNKLKDLAAQAGAAGQAAKEKLLGKDDSEA